MINKSRYTEALGNSFLYLDYRQHIAELYADHKTTGSSQSEDYLNYTNMNIRRMDRLDKKAELSPETIEAIQSIDTPMIWLTLTEAWCADAAQTIPYLSKMAELNDHIDLRLILRDDNLDIMDAHQFHGTRSIPRVIVLNSSMNVIGEWGPRPEDAHRIVHQAKIDKAATRDGAIKAVIDYEKVKDLQFWYKKDKGAGMQRELIDIVTQ